MSSSSDVELKHVTRRGPEPRYLSGSQNPAQDVQGRGGSSNGGSENGLPTNEYDIIKETAQRGGSSRTTQREQTENPLYGDHGTLPVAHPTLTAEKKERDSALSYSPLIPSETSSRNEITCGGGGALDCALFVVLSFALFVAVGALVLVLLLFTGTYRTPGSATTMGLLGEATTATTAPTTETTPTNHSNSSNTTSIDYQMVLDGLNSAVQQLSSLLDALSNQVFLNQSAISARIDGLMASGRSLDFSSCQTFQRTVCPLAATIPCITYASPSNDSFVLNYFCAVTNTSNERNPIIAILAQDPVNGYYCFCQILSSTVSSGVSCSLFVTVCPVVNGTLSVV